MEYTPGQIVTGSFVIEQISVNNKFAEIMIKNDDIRILAILKDNVDLFTKTYSVGEKIACKGKIRKRRKFNCLDLIYISKNILETKITNKFNLETYLQRYQELVDSIVDQDYRQVLNCLFNDDVKEMFFNYPAAKSNHHNYQHGLLQHSIEVVDISLLIGNYFEPINRDLLICAGLIHDIGKLKSYDVDEDKIKITKTDWDSLLGHLSMSTIFLSKIIPSEFDPHKAMLLYHMILSHHGELKNGSPVEFKTKEAYIMHKADLISATLNHVSALNFTNNWAKDELTNRSWYQKLGE